MCVAAKLNKSNKTFLWPIPSSAQQRSLLDVNFGSADIEGKQDSVRVGRKKCRKLNKLKFVHEENESCLRGVLSQSPEVCLYLLQVEDGGRWQQQFQLNFVNSLLHMCCSRRRCTCSQRVCRHVRPTQRHLWGGEATKGIHMLAECRVQSKEVGPGEVEAGSDSGQTVYGVEDLDEVNHEKGHSLAPQSCSFSRHGRS